MTLEQLRIFVAVAERQHVTEAAHALHLTQSAVSAAVSALESRYCVKLFDRIGRNIRLTEAGRRFAVEARAVLARATEAETVLHDLTGLKRGAVALSASQTVGNYWLPQCLQAYRSNNPGIALSLAIGNTEEVRADVLESRADLGFVEGRITDQQLSVLPVATDELVLVARPGLYPEKRKALSRQELAKLPWVFREQGSGTRTELEEALAKAGVPLNKLTIVLELPSNEAVRSAVLAGAGVAVLSRHVVDVPVMAGTLEELPFPLPSRRFYVLRHKARYVSEAVRAFLDMIQAAPTPRRAGDTNRQDRPTRRVSPASA